MDDSQDVEEEHLADATKSLSLEDAAPPASTEEKTTGVTIITSEDQNVLTLSAPLYTLRWAAPELMEEDKATLATDIWAAGWVCWEVNSSFLS